MDENEDPLETLSSLEKELGELTDWIEPDNDQTITANETTHLQTPDTIPGTPPLSGNVSEQAQQPITQNIEEEAMTNDKKSNFSMANNIMLSVGLIAVLIAALAIWLSLDASQEAAKLASAPAKLQQQIDQMEKHQEKQTLLLQQQIENLQHQLKILTNVIANKTTEQWRKAIEEPSKKTIKNAPKKVQAKQTKAKISQPKAKPVLEKKIILKKTAATKTTPKVLPESNIASSYAAKAGSVQGWVVYLFSTASQKSAEREARQYKAKDIKAKYIRVISKGKVWYHVLVGGFKTEREAAAFKKFVKEYHGIDAWYNKSAHKIIKSNVNKASPAKKSVSTKKTVTAKPISQNTGQTTTARHTFRFKAIDTDVWLQISAANADGTAKGKMLKEVLLKPGHYTTIKAASESLWITTGNAPALSISVDGKLVAKKGSLGNGKKVLRNYRFNIK